MKRIIGLLFVAAALSSCSKHDIAETPVLPEPVVEPEPQPLAIAFAEGNSLQFAAGETKIVHYTITGGNANNVVKAELQKPDGTYTVETTSTSATEGMIAITAKMPEAENCVLIIVSDGSQIVTAKIAVSPKAGSEELAITFAEGNSLEFAAGETKIVHYTITGGSDNVVVKAEMQKSDDAYTVEMASTSATEGTIKITAKTPTDNRVIVSVSDGSQTIMAAIDVTVILRPSFDGKTIVVETPGTLWSLLGDYDIYKNTELTVIGNLNSSDIWMLKNLPNLAALDMEYANLEELPAEAFRDNTSLISVKLPKTLKTIGIYAFSSCSSLTSVTIGNSVTTIGELAFYGCSGLTSITIPDGVTSIRAYTFCGCDNLTSITIPDNVTSIGSRAFYGCSGLTTFYGKFASSDNRCLIVDGCLTAFAPAGLISYTIPDGVTTIGYAAFYMCSSLTSITIPDNVTEIGGRAFYMCSSLTSLTIPESVTSIERQTFWNCSSLTSIYCKAQTPPDLGTDVFYDVRATLYVPIGSKTAYAAADGWGNCFTTIIETRF